MKRSFTESDLMEFVRSDFEQIGYTTYAEVCYKGGGSKRCDLFAINETINHSIVFEAKLSFNLKVIEQCYQWRNHANDSYIIIPKVYRNIKTIKLARIICEHLGIGVIEVDFKRQIYDMTVKSKNVDNPILPKLYDEQKLTISSNSKSDFITPFKITVKSIDEYMLDKSEIYLNDLIQNIKHHYKSNLSATNAIKSLVERKIIKNYFITKLNNKIILNKI